MTRFNVTVADGSVCTIEAAEFTIGTDGVLIFSVADAADPPSPLRAVFAVSRWRFVESADAEVSWPNQDQPAPQPKKAMLIPATNPESPRAGW